MTLLEGAVEMIHGPGCPVCVTPLEQIDKALVIASQPGVIFTSPEVALIGLTEEEANALKGMEREKFDIPLLIGGATTSRRSRDPSDRR